MAELSANDFTNIDGPALGDGSNSHSTYETVALQHQPLPEYTKNWGPHLYRPAKLPDNYDTRIDPAHIFVFTVHPITGIQRDFYVTPKPCDYCAKVRQLCSRTRPHCGRCGAREERQCVFEEGWVRLPGPKCLKPKRKRDEGGKDVTKKPKKPRASGAQAADTLDTGKAGPSKSMAITGLPASTAIEKPGEPRGSEQISGPPTIQPSTQENTLNELASSTMAAMAALSEPLPTAEEAAQCPSRTSSRYGLRQNPKRSVKVS